MILRTLCEQVMSMGRTLAATFVDYSAAFDTVSHIFIDKALRTAGVSNKLRAMFRAVYTAASAFTTVNTADGGKVKSATFPVRRGVVQGDITSPLYFILALELILRMHDTVEDKGITLADTVIHTLGYADDVALIEYGEEKGIKNLSTRLTNIAEGSKKDADMSISIEKTKTLHVREQDPVSKTRAEEAAEVCKYVCPHLNCEHRFLTKRGMQIHASRCEWRDEFVVDRIMDHKGKLAQRKFLISWKGYKKCTWVPRSNVHPELIEEYEKANGCYDYSWPFRCDQCGLPCASDVGVNIHKRKAHKTQEKSQSFAGTLADKKVQREKKAAQQSQRPTVMCGNEEISNVFNFRYLGTLFSSDADQSTDVESRIAQAMQRFGQLRHIFNSSDISTKLKIRLYSAAV